MGPILEFIENNTNLIIAITAVFALFVSVISIIMTSIALGMQRRHNYKSLTPIASIPFSDYENLIAVNLRNTGTGPLIVEKFMVIKGEEVKDDIVSWMPPPPKSIDWDTFYDNLDGLSIPPTETETVIKLSGDEKEKIYSEYRDKVRKVLSQLTVKVIYRDIYGRRMAIKEKSLEWFGRHF